MKFSTSRESLLHPLQAVIGVVERRQTMPVLANVLLAVENGRLSMTATDLEVELVALTDVDDVVAGGEIGEPTMDIDVSGVETNGGRRQDRGRLRVRDVDDQEIAGDVGEEHQRTDELHA